MTVDFSEEERLFLKESLRYSQMEFEGRASKYFGDDGYREIYLEKKEMFRSVQAKLNKR